MSATHPILSILFPSEPRPIEVELDYHAAGGYCLRMHTLVGPPVTVGRYPTKGDANRVAERNCWQVIDSTIDQLFEVEIARLPGGPWRIASTDPRRPMVVGAFATADDARAEATRWGWAIRDNK